jgi:hypothetical protein
LTQLSIPKAKKLARRNEKGKQEATLIFSQKPVGKHAHRLRWAKHQSFMAKKKNCGND